MILKQRCNWYFYALKGQHKRPFNTAGAIFYEFIYFFFYARQTCDARFCFLIFFLFSFKIPFITAVSKSTTNVILNDFRRAKKSLLSLCIAQPAEYNDNKITGNKPAW